MENNKFIKYFNNLYDESIPLVFTDGTDIYNDLKKEYITHKNGYFIYGPSGVGKTYFINNQKEKIGLTEIFFGQLLRLFLMVTGGIYQEMKLILLKGVLM